MEVAKVIHYYYALKSFKCKETEKIFRGRFSKKLPSDIQDRALIKLLSKHFKIEEVCTGDVIKLN